MHGFATGASFPGGMSAAEHDACEDGIAAQRHLVAGLRRDVAVYVLRDAVWPLGPDEVRELDCLNDALRLEEATLTEFLAEVGR